MYILFTTWAKCLFMKPLDTGSGKVFLNSKKNPGNELCYQTSSAKCYTFCKSHRQRTQTKRSICDSYRGQYMPVKELNNNPPSRWLQFFCLAFNKLASAVQLRYLKETTTRVENVYLSSFLGAASFLGDLPFGLCKS